MLAVFWDHKCLILMQLLDFRDTVTAERYCIVERLTAGHSWQNPSVAVPLPSLMLPSGFGATTKGLWTTVLTVPISCPMVSIPLVPLTLVWQTSSNRRRCEVRCNFLVAEPRHRSFLRRDNKSLMSG